MKKLKVLDDVERKLIWMSIRYAMGSGTIACTTLPSDIIKKYSKRMDVDLKKAMAKEIKNYFAVWKVKFDDKNMNYIKDIWIKFSTYLSCEFYNVYVKKIKKPFVCFKYNGNYYPVNKYEKNSYVDEYILGYDEKIENVKFVGELK